MALWITDNAVTIGADGTALIADAASPHGVKFGTPSGSSILPGSGWKTGLDIDFAAQGSQTINADGNYTIAGLTWTKANSTNDSSAMLLTNGTGLIITPKTTGSWSATTRTSPALYTSLISAMPGYDFSCPIRMWCYISSDNPATTFDCTIFGLDNMAASSGNILQSLVFRGFPSSATSSIQSVNDTVSASSSRNQATTLATATRVIMFEWPSGFWGPAIIYTAAIGGSNAWPGYTSLNWVQTVVPGAGGTNPGGSPSDLSITNIILTAVRIGSGTAYTTTIRKLRVDYRP